MYYTSTRTLLQNYEDNPYIILGYFFHDRDIDRVQKSVLDVQSKILYQILRKRGEYVSLIYTFCCQLLEACYRV